MTLNNDIRIIDHIASRLLKHIDDGGLIAIRGSGLFTGTWGMILFLSHYLSFRRNKHNQRLVEDYLLFCLTKLQNDPQPASYCSGIAGILNCINFLNHSSFWDIECSDLNCDSALLETMIQNFRQYNYDLT